MWLGLLAVVATLFALQRLALWAESRGWIYWRCTRRRGGSSLGDAFLEVQSLIEPDKRHVLVERRREVDAEQTRADPPRAGNGSGARRRDDRMTE